jgi:NAD(P)-dependent dehydrogenase (short-subunit alcohol dehydrogenase family)
MTAFALADKVCLITGATGIAAATARLAVREGGRVFLASLRPEDGRALHEAIRADGPEPAFGFQAADLTRAAEVKTAVEACVERFGRIDAVFNVAGISGRRFGDGPVHEATEEGWDVTLDTNLKSMFLVCREAIWQMLRQPVTPADGGAGGGTRGAVLNMASVLAFAPEPTFFATHAYAASKAAVIGLSRSMAGTYAPHKIRVNALAPALVRTPMSARAQEDPAILERMRTKQPLCEGLIDPDDVARAAVFLLGDAARMITGDVLTVDAGWCVSG